MRGTGRTTRGAVAAFQSRSEEAINMGLLNRALIDDGTVSEEGSLITFNDSYYSITLDGLGIATYRVDTETTNYYYTYDPETMLLTLRTASMQLAGVMKVSTYNGRYIYMPYDENSDLDITVGNTQLTLDGAYIATYNDGTTTINGYFVTEESVFGSLATVYSRDTGYKFIITSPTIQVPSEEDDGRSTTVTTYRFERQPCRNDQD